MYSIFSIWNPSALKNKIFRFTMFRYYRHWLQWYGIALTSCFIVLPFQQSMTQTSAIRFEQKVIASESFESVAVFDVDGDRTPDIVSGSFWYKGPDFRIRTLIDQQPRYGEYYDDFSTIPLDVNADGRTDFVTGGWWGNTIRWKENPGRDTIWKEHVIATTGNVETTRAWDIDADGALELVPNTPGHPLKIYRKEKGSRKFSVHEVASSHGHGLGFGDVNGDGRGDLIVADGWLQAPSNPYQGKWIYHRQFTLGLASVPIVVTDVDGDRLADLIYGKAHDYGLYWMKQKRVGASTQWEQHAIDTGNSQFHTMEWVDIDNDGVSELITGKRFRAHNEKDPGSFDPVGLYIFRWNGKTFDKETISLGVDGKGKGTGIQFAVADVDGNGLRDIVVAGKDGLSVFYNRGR
jgi:hypothetical protein